MIDANQFGMELADIVKAATAPLIDRISALEKALSDRPQKGEDGRDGEDGKDGSSVALDDVLPALQEQVTEYLKAIPAPKDGADGRDGAPGERGEKGDPGRDGTDGVGAAGALIDRDGNLILTLTNGETKALGVVVGKDGAAGADGKDGADGLGFDDLAFETDEHGRVVAKFQRGSVVKSALLPGIVDRGPFKAGEAYQKGDAVSYGGSLWIAQGETGDRPDGSASWRLAVKKGRDGKGGA